MPESSRMNRRDVSIGLAVAIAGAMGATARAAASTIVEVSMNDRVMTFQPAIVTIKAGDTVRWINRGVMPHTVSFAPAVAKAPGLVALPAGVMPFDSGDLEQDDVFGHQFTAKGTYGYVCRYHQRMGMVGKVIVR